MPGMPCLFVCALALLVPACVVDGAQDIPGTEDDSGGGGKADGDAACAGLGARDAAWAELEADVLRLTNERRANGATCGTQAFPSAPALRRDARLTCAARLHSADMAARDYFAHVSPDGAGPETRIRRAGAAVYTLGENIAAGQMSADEVVEGWMASPGHCRNIMNSAFSIIGIGFDGGTIDTDSGPVPGVWTQDFGGY